jgi:hypothetical protein
MPKEFDRCVRGGGRVRTKSLPKSRHVKICWPKGGGSPVRGHVAKNKTRKKCSRRSGG